MNSALQKLQDFEEKPFFIDRVFLETLAQQLTVPVLELKQQPQTKSDEPPIIQQINQINTDENAIFYPYARDIKSNLIFWKMLRAN